MDGAEPLDANCGVEREPGSTALAVSAELNATAAPPAPCAVAAALAGLYDGGAIAGYGWWALTADEWSGVATGPTADAANAAAWCCSDKCCWLRTVRGDSDAAGAATGVVASATAGPFPPDERLRE